jgi:C4-dicarboxylate-specific signal transduction histidine kinase
LFGSRSSEFAPFNLKKVVDEIAEIVMPSLEAKKITLKREYQSNPVAYGDSIQIQQVLINTLNNAIDALIDSNVKQKEIVIGIANNENTATITIKDNGGGIDQDLLLTIFDLYKTTKKEGLGVGLWLSKTIMESHHGSISASNDPKGGAIFKIDIPMQHTLGK